MSRFVLSARLALLPPTNVRQIYTSISNQLSNISTAVTLTGPNNVPQIVNRINSQLRGVNRNINVNINARNNLRSVGASIRSITHATNQAADSMEALGVQASKTVRKYGAFTIATTGFLKLSQAISGGIDEAIAYDREMVRIAQVTGTSLQGLNGLSKEVTRLSTTFGVSSEKILESAVTLSQAGLSAKDTKVALEALAKTGLSATFGDISQTGEAAIAIMQQFKYNTQSLTSVMSSINAVSAAFAVESEDIAVAVRRAGGALEAAGVNFHEFQALLTSVRQTTRESAESIATGFRTIFARLQRVRTQNFLKDLGIDVLNDKGLFVGGYEAIGRISKALKGLQGTDPRFAQIIEELGGFRQVSKVIPLIEQFDVAQKALNVSMRGGDSLTKDAEIAQQSLAVQINKTKESFLAFVRGLAEDEYFKQTVRSVLSLANAFIEVARAAKPFYTLIGAIASFKLANSVGPLARGFKKDWLGFNTGGFVPGTGDSDNVPAMLTPGEFVIKKSSARAIGYGNLHKMNKYAEGGPVGLNRKKLGSKFNGNPDFAAERQTKYVDGIKTYDFGYATLSPVGELYDYNFPVDNKSFKNLKGKTRANIHVRGMTDEVSNSITSSFQKTIADAVYSKASEFGFVGKPVKLDPTQVPNINSAVGGMFEGMIKSLRGNLGSVGKGGKNLDFVGGLGDISKLFVNSDALKTNPTDAKAVFNDTQRASMVAKAVSFIADSQDKVKAKNQNTAIAVEQNTSGVSPLEQFAAAAYDIVRQGWDIKTGSRAIQQALGITSGRFEELKKELRAAGGLGRFDIRHRDTIRRDTIKRNTGGTIPGQGDSDTVPALLTPGEFVINKTSAKAIGHGNLSKLNRYAKGGVVTKKQKRLNREFSDINSHGISQEANNQTLHKDGLVYSYINQDFLNSLLKNPVGNDRAEGQVFRNPKYMVGAREQYLSLPSLTDNLALETFVKEGQVGKEGQNAVVLPANSQFKILDSNPSLTKLLRLDGRKDSDINYNRPLDGDFATRIYDIPDHEKSTIRSYAGNSFYKINGLLRGNVKGDGWNHHHDNLDSSIAKSIISRDLNVFRGVGPKRLSGIEKSIGTNINSPDAVGRVFVDKGFVSTSIRSSVARRFGDHLFSIKVQKGQAGLVLDESFMDEGEILLPRNSAFRITQNSEEDRTKVDLINPILNYGVVKGVKRGPDTIKSTVPKDLLRRNTGGPIDGQGDSDTIPALLTPGEFVINKKAAKRIGYSTLSHMNRSGKSIRKFNNGGAAYPVFQSDPHTNLSQSDRGITRGDRFNGPDPATIGIGLFALSEVLDKAFGENSSLTKLTKAALSLYGAFTVYAAVFKQSGKMFGNSKALYKYTNLGRANAKITTDSVANSDPAFVAKIRAKKDVIRSNARQNLKTVRAGEETELETKDRLAAIAKSDKAARSATNTFRRKIDPFNNSFTPATRGNFIDRINNENIPINLGSSTLNKRQAAAEDRADKNVKRQIRDAAKKGQTFTVQEIAQRTTEAEGRALKNINSENKIFSDTDLIAAYEQSSYDKNIGRNMTGVITGTKKRKKRAKKNVANSAATKEIFDARDEELAAVIPDMKGELEQRVKNLRRKNFLKQKRLVEGTGLSRSFNQSLLL